MTMAMTMVMTMVMTMAQGLDTLVTAMAEVTQVP
jgi:hypothetical protein